MRDRSFQVATVDDAHADAAGALLVRFFAEEGFHGNPAAILSRFDVLRRDAHHWAAAALDTAGEMIGVVTVTTMLYVEWGRMAEIGDLYVLPSHRGRGVARALVEAAEAWGRAVGCSAIEVVITAEGETSHRLSDFYAALGYGDTGRRLALKPLALPARAGEAGRPFGK